jgi:hypothetical protein
MLTFYNIQDDIGPYDTSLGAFYFGICGLGS